MGQEINLLDRYPRSSRPIDQRGSEITDADRAIARQFGESFFDGDRVHGYGGYNYHPRFWQETVKRIRDHYGLADDAHILDVGCAKGFMLYDFKELMPNLTIAGIDVSEYAIANAIDPVKDQLRIADARELPFPDDSFDLVISINTVHNLNLDDCKQSLQEIQRVTRSDAFITVDAWYTDEGRRSFLDWNLTALTYMHADDWKELFNQVAYQGDYYWFFAE